MLIMSLYKDIELFKKRYADRHIGGKTQNTVYQIKSALNKEFSRDKDQKVEVLKMKNVLLIHGFNGTPKIFEYFKEKNDAILFDLDGTLWEVADETHKSVNEITKKYKLKEVDINTIHSVFGLNRIESAKLYFPYLDIEKSIELMKEISIVNIRNLKEHGGNVYPNLENVLKKLIENYQLFIVSNTGHREYIEAFLATSGLNKYFVDYIAASELNISKADGISKIIQDYNIRRAIYVGDTKKDMEASKIANIPFIQARYGFGDDLETEYYINSIEELPKVIDLITNNNI